MTLRILTIDLERDFCDANSTKSLEKVMPKLLDLLDKRKIKVTFFVVSDLVKTHKNLILEIKNRGHEIASHSKTHTFLNAKNSLEEISSSRKDFSEIGIQVEGFRAPAFITANTHFKDLKKSGYLYDSSFAVFFPGRYRNFWLGFKPKPYAEKFQDDKGFRQKNIIELPMPTSFWPLVNSGFSYYRLFYPLSYFFPLQYMFYLHPWELLDWRDVSSHSKNPLLRALLSRYTGKRAWRLLNQFLDKHKRKGTKWVTCSEYIRIKKLI